MKILPMFILLIVIMLITGAWTIWEDGTTITEQDAYILQLEQQLDLEREAYNAEISTLNEHLADAAALDGIDDYLYTHSRYIEEKAAIDTIIRARQLLLSFDPSKSVNRISCTRSMYPAIHCTGLAIFEHPNNTKYGVGDVVVYSRPRINLIDGIRTVNWSPQYSRYPWGGIMHRITGEVKGKGWILQGDNNEKPDPWIVPYDQIMYVQYAYIEGVDPLNPER